jgi:predicted ATP-dependent endonuclease of OLD family
MKLSRIKIEKLFGQFDYDIKLNQDEGITILTGPNGYGKTTILNIVYALLSGDSLNAKYTKATLFFSDGRRLEAPKDEDAIKNLIPVYFIKDQRLTYSIAAKHDGTFKYNGKSKYNGVAVLDKIDLFSKNLVERISQIKSEEDKLALDLANTFPDRLLRYEQPLHRTVFEERFEKLFAKQQHLQSYGITPGVFTKSEYEGENQRVLSVYLEDYERKTSLYDELIAKIDLLLSIMEAKCLINKTFTIDAAQGFCFTNSDGKPLDLSNLSSGEQHETILFYEMLFNAPPDSLVLIDEPETSIHVAWQHSFLSDLKKIREINSASFFVVTHSPSLINEHWDWSIDLFDLTKEAKNG